MFMNQFWFMDKDAIMEFDLASFMDLFSDEINRKDDFFFFLEQNKIFHFQHLISTDITKPIQRQESTSIQIYKHRLTKQALF